MDQTFRGLRRSHGKLDDMVRDEKSLKITGKAVTKHEPVTEDLWQAHLDGKTMVGIVPLDENLMCLWGGGDVDDYKDIDHSALARKIADSGWRAILCVSKSGGVHIFLFATEPVPGQQMKNAVEAMMADLGFPVPPNEAFPKQAEGKDWKAGPGLTPGNFIYMPYFNVNGMCSTFAYGLTGDRLLVEEFLKLADKLAYPPSFFDHPGFKRPRPAEPKRNSAKPNAPRERRPMQHWFDHFIAKLVPEDTCRTGECSHKRNDTGRDFICQLRDEKYEANEIKESGIHREFVAEANKRCSKTPKYTNGEIEASIQQAFKRDPRDPAPERKKITREMYMLLAEGKIRETFTLAVDSAGRVHFYDEERGTYVFDQHEKFFVILKQVLAGEGHMMSVTDQKTLLANLAIGTQKLWENPPQEVINTKTGLINVMTRERMNHSKDHLWANQLDIEYDPMATCPKVEKFLNEILHPADIEFLFEFMGYLLIPRMGMQKALLMYGTGSNGKGNVVKLIQGLLGIENCSSALLKDIEGNRFTISTMVGKLVNIEEDFTAGLIPGSGNFKNITGGGVVRVEQKFCTPHDVALYCRMIISSNSYPRSGDNTNAWWRRWLVLPFTKKDFENVDFTDRIEPEDLMPPLLAEAPGMLNRALNAYAAMRQRGKGFTESPAMIAAKLDFRHCTDTLSDWLDEFTLEGVSLAVPQRDLRVQFNNYCRSKHYSEMSEKDFTDKVIQFRPKVTTEPRRDRVYFMGIGLRERKHEGDPNDGPRYCSSASPPAPVNEELPVDRALF